ncbi:Uncharacterized protein SCF082_LOCUS11210, partial [Durusdinium trenchii]
MNYPFQLMSQALRANDETSKHWDDLVEGPCWKSPSEAKRCCHGRALSLREELVSQMERLETQWPWCGEASNYVHKRFMSQGMRPGAARQEVSEEDEAARALYRFGRLSGHPNCGPEALREDDGAHEPKTREPRRRQLARSPLGCRAKSREAVDVAVDVDLAEHRNASGLFVDPLGPPRNETPPDAKRVRFLRSFAEPENLAELLRKVDVDGCDCVLAALALRLLRPKFIIMEINWSIPPPLRFDNAILTGANPGPSGLALARLVFGSSLEQNWWSSVGFRFTSHGCSLSGASAEFAPFGYSLWRLAGMVNAVWVHREVAHLLGAEVDEVNCFNHAWRSPDLVRYLHWSVIHDWRTGPVRAALAHAWGNLT